jgi:hypothetical protein
MRHRTDRFRSRCIVVLGLMCATASPVRAQVNTGNIVPNFDRIRVGQVEGLEGGAYVARTGDGGANWYNPAGLSLAPGSSINASTNAYEFTNIRLEGLNQRFSAGRFQSLGTYFAGVIGAPIVSSSSPLRLGFSFTRPVRWNPGAVAGQLGAMEPGTGGELLEFYSKVEMDVAIPAIAAGYRLTDRIRVGVRIGMPITTLKADNQTSNRLVDAEMADRIYGALSLDGQTYQMQFTGGVQWDVSDRVRAGVTVTSPGLPLWGSSLLAIQDVETIQGSTLDFSFRDASTTFEYPLPLRVVAGVAATLGRFEVEADVRFHGSRAPFDLFASDERYILISTATDGTSLVVDGPAPTVREEIASVTNLALGANYDLAGSWELHAGVFTDRSPVGDPATSQFQAVDLTGFGVAVSFGGQLSGTIGLSSNWGTTEDRQFGPALGGGAGSTQVRIQTFNLHYALSYTFDGN